MAYTAPPGDAANFSASPGTYAAPLGNAVNFPAPNESIAAIPFVRGYASGKVIISGVATGLHTHPGWARFGIASGKVKINGVAIGAHGVSGEMSGRIYPRPAPAVGLRSVPRINPITGAIEMVATLPPCVHHNEQIFQP